MYNPITLNQMTSYEMKMFNEGALKYLNVTKYGAISPKGANCIDLDFDVKKITDEIAQLRKSFNNDTKIGFLSYARELILKKFNGFDCETRIEETRLAESATLETKGAILSEQSVLKKSFVEQNIYIILGGIILLTATFILIKKK
jgi:hypothetical protein